MSDQKTCILPHQNQALVLLIVAVLATSLILHGAASAAAPQEQQATGQQPGDRQKEQQGQKSGSRSAKNQPAEFYIIVAVPAVRPVVLPAGGTLAPDAEDIRDTLASATEAALTKGGFDDLVERFVDADRNRIGRTQLTDLDLPTLDGRIEQIRKAWKDKYGSEFDIDDEDRVYGTFPIVQGEVTRHGARLAAAAESPADRIAGNEPEDRNLEPGRNVALVTVPKSEPRGQAQQQQQQQGQQGMNELSVLMIQEQPDAWKIDVPQQVSSHDLYDNLLKHLTQFGENVQNWPADEAEAYRQVTYHVLAAVIGQGAKQGQAK